MFGTAGGSNVRKERLPTPNSDDSEECENSPAKRPRASKPSQAEKKKPRASSPSEDEAMDVATVIEILELSQRLTSKLSEDKAWAQLEVLKEHLTSAEYMGLPHNQPHRTSQSRKVGENDFTQEIRRHKVIEQLTAAKRIVAEKQRAAAAAAPAAAASSSSTAAATSDDASSAKKKPRSLSPSSAKKKQVYRALLRVTPPPSDSEEDSDQAENSPAKRKRPSKPPPQAHSKMSTAPQPILLQEWDLDLSTSEIADSELCDIQCFYCLGQLRANSRFVLCETCEGFVACLQCWNNSSTSAPPQTRKEHLAKFGHVADLEARKQRLLVRDAGRENGVRYWPRLHEHQFDMQGHADWTDPDKGHFHIYTYKQVDALRRLEVAWKSMPASQAAASSSPPRRHALHASDPSQPQPLPLSVLGRTHTQLLSQRSAKPQMKQQSLISSLFAQSQPTYSEADALQVQQPTGPFEEASKSLMQIYADAKELDPPLPDLEVRASPNIEQRLGHPCQLGVFATVDISAGQLITEYAAHLVHADYFKHNPNAPKTHTRKIPNSDQLLHGAPTAALFVRYVPRNGEAVKRLLALPAASFLPPPGTPARELLDTLPVGCMINSPAGIEGAEANVVMTTLLVKKEGNGWLKGQQMDRMRASRDIKIGEELFCAYKNNEEKAGFVSAQ